jgi:hypothetical protein
MCVCGGEEGPHAGVGGGEGIGAGGGLAGEMGRHANYEGVVLVLLVEDGELDRKIGRGRSRLDCVIAGWLGRRGRALTGHLSRLRSSMSLLFLDAFRPHVDWWGF